MPPSLPTHSPEHQTLHLLPLHALNAISPALAAFAASSVCHQGLLGNRGCLCLWQECHRFGTVTQPLLQATGQLKMGVGGAAIKPQNHQQDQGVLPGPCLQGRGDKFNSLNKNYRFICSFVISVQVMHSPRFVLCFYRSYAPYLFQTSETVMPL